MVRKILVIFFAFLIILLLPKSHANAQACLSCPDKPTLGSGGLVSNNGLDPANCPLSQDRCCHYSFSGQDYYFTPNTQAVCTTTCDPKTGCTSAGNPGGSLCAKSGTICTSDSDCSGASCTDYHCMLGGYIAPPGTNSLSGATCQYQPNAVPAPPSGGSPAGSPCTGNSDCASNICQQDASGNHTCQAPVGSPTYGGGFGGDTTTFSCGNGANAVWTLSCVFPLIANLIYWLLILSAVVATFSIIFAGIRLTTSGGDPKTVDNGKKILTFAIIGLVLIFLSFFILNTIGDVTGLACIKPGNPLSFSSCK